MNGNSPITCVGSNPVESKAIDVELVRRTIFPGSTNDELALFLHECVRRGVHPMDRQIHPLKYSGKVSFITGIDYLRSEADKSGNYAPGKEPTFVVDGKTNRLVSATAYIRKFVKDQWFDVSATARWDEYFPGDQKGWMWKRMPNTMLAKCAEGLAIRKAFPSLGQLYTREEMDQAQRDTDPYAGQLNERGQPKIALDDKPPVIEAETVGPPVFNAETVGADLQAGFDDMAAGKPTEEEERKAINKKIMEMLGDIADDSGADLNDWPEDMARKDKMRAHCVVACGTGTLKGAPIEDLRKYAQAISDYYASWKLGEPEPEEPEQVEEQDEFEAPPKEPEKKPEPVALPKGAPENMVVRFGAHKGKNLMELASGSIEGGRQTLGYIVHKMGTKNDKGEQVEYFVKLKEASRWYLDNVKEKRK